MGEEKQNQLVPVGMSLPEIKEMANAVVRSGLFPAIKTADAAVTLMWLCQAEGLHPITALRRYHIIQGTPAMKSDALLGEFQRRGGKVRWVKTDDKVCEAVFLAPGVEGEAPVRWTIEDAQRIGLTSKDNWKNYPRAMLRARVVSEGIRMSMPEIIAGIPSAEEAQDHTVSYTAPAASEKTVEQPAPERAKVDPPTLALVVAALKGAGFATKEQQTAELSSQTARTIERGRDLFQDEALAIVDRLASMPEPGSAG
jgi:hypothetical protein